MIPIISIVGKTNSGKTTLIEKLILELRKRGLRVGTIKHDIHGSFQIDREGKDTWRHKQAGATTVLIASSRKLGLISDTNKEFSLDELARKFFDHVDIILTEGYKSHQKPKIEVVKSENNPKPLCGKDDNLIALVSEKQLKMEVPVFSMEEASKLAEFIINNFLRT